MSEQSKGVEPMATIINVVGECKFLGKEYVIRSIRDLHEIPDDKLEGCFADLLASILTYRHIIKLSGVKCEPLEEIKWIDDGKHDLAVELRQKIKESVVGKKQ